MGCGLKEMDDYAGQQAQAVERQPELGAGAKSGTATCPLCRAASIRVDGTSDFWAEFAALSRVAKAAEAVVKAAIVAGKDLKAEPTSDMAILARRLSDLAVIRLGAREGEGRS